MATPGPIALEFRDIDFDHNKADAAVMKDLADLHDHLERLMDQPDRDNDSPQNLMTVLIIMAVATRCPFMLEGTDLSDAMRTYGENLTPIVRACWKDQNFRKIRKIGMSAILLSANLTIYLTFVSRTAEAAGFIFIVSKCSRRAK